LPKESIEKRSVEESVMRIIQCKNENSTINNER
jgi:hypothetical protein